MRTVYIKGKLRTDHPASDWSEVTVATIISMVRRRVETVSAKCFLVFTNPVILVPKPK